MPVISTVLGMSEHLLRSTTALNMEKHLFEAPAFNMRSVAMGCALVKEPEDCCVKHN
jgi:hypothetical protein